MTFFRADASTKQRLWLAISKVGKYWLGEHKHVPSTLFSGAWTPHMATGLPEWVALSACCPPCTQQCTSKWIPDSIASVVCEAMPDVDPGQVQCVALLMGIPCGAPPPARQVRGVVLGDDDGGAQILVPDASSPVANGQEVLGVEGIAHQAIDRAMMSCICMDHAIRLNIHRVLIVPWLCLSPSPHLLLVVFVACSPCKDVCRPLPWQCDVQPGQGQM